MAGQIHVIGHPLVQHKLTLLRAKETSTGNFRALVRESARDHRRTLQCALAEPRAHRLHDRLKLPRAHRLAVEPLPHLDDQILLRP